jgi:hypothetical protein
MAIHNTITVKRLAFMDKNHLDDQLRARGRADVITPSRIKLPDVILTRAGPGQPL